MKKLAVIHTVLIACAFPVCLFAQEGTMKFKNPFDDARKTTSFGAMYCLPVGDFGSTNLEKGGFANPGWGLYFDSKSTFKGGLTFISHSTYAWIPLNQESIAKAFTENLGRKTEVTGGKHKPFLSTVGVGYDFKAASFLTIGISAQAGVLYNSFKGFDMTVYDSTGTSVLFTDNFKYDSEFSLAYVFGAKFNFSLIKDLISFQVSVDYSGAKFDSYLRSYQLQPIKTTQHIQIVNIGAGFAFHTK
ncbi:hypothetical protein [uncultured Fluviicola sp.]|uniref:hypothetical protein n=1 Tax=uncultured Fluviicola sp. TaxID=463303 RepID=UPI0025F657A1|nr:hypothetical protein [uncultured Fluviicola sp.]